MSPANFAKHEGPCLLHGGKNGIREAKTLRRRLRPYQLTVEEYHAMFARQNGVCQICKNSNDDERNLCVDHDHATNRVRGLLCHRCNLVLGAVEDSTQLLDNMKMYLENACRE